MSKRVLLPALVLLILGLPACSDEPTIIVDPPALSLYSEALTHPDSLINDLMVSYRRREISPYANLLGKEFIFHFLPQDAGDIPDGVWNKDQDSTGTYNLFTDPGVSRITIDLEWNAPVPDEIRGEAVQRVEVTYVDLKVDIDGGATTLAVPGDRQLFYFQKGDEPGEDPDRWYLVDWEDLGGSGTLFSDIPNTWSAIKRGLSRR